jgi:lysophospholipase L1-like esterase
MALLSLSKGQAPETQACHKRRNHRNPPAGAGSYDRALLRSRRRQSVDLIRDMRNSNAEIHLRAQAATTEHSSVAADASRWISRGRTGSIQLDTCPPTSHSKTMQGRTIKRIMLATTALLITLALAEGICRVMQPPRPSMRFQQDINELNAMQLHSATRIIRDDPELFWSLTPDTRLPSDAWPFRGVISNGQSLREDHPIPDTKPSGALRILFLGDSCTFGYGVASHEAFAQVAESLLRSATPDTPIECINAGVPGYSLFQGRRYLESRGLDHAPDLVVLNFGWNDYAAWDNRSDDEHYLAMRAAQPPVLLHRSRLAQRLWAARHAKRATGTDTRPRVLPHEFASLLNEVKAITDAADIELLILVWPMRGNADPATPPTMRAELQREMLTFGNAHPLPGPPNVTCALDLVPLARTLVAKHGIDAIYFDNGHVTPLAHNAFAQAIVAKIEPWVRANTN